MKKVIFVPGTKIDFCSYLNNMQEYIFENVYTQISPFIDQYGVACNTVSGGVLDPADNSFKISVAGIADSITVGTGEALTSGHHYMYWIGGTSVVEIPASGVGNYTLYAKYTPVNQTPKARVAGFLYDPSTNYAYTEQNYQVDFTTVNPGVSGVLLGSGYYNGTLWNPIYDSRVPLKFKSGCMPDEVFRKYGIFQNYGGLKSDSFAWTDVNSGTILTITATGLQATVTYDANDLSYALANRHAAGSETTFTNATLTASGSTILTNRNAIARTSQTTATAQDEFTRLFRFGILNFNGRLDGSGDKRVLTTPIPSTPGTPTGLTATLIQSRKDNNYAIDLSAAMLTYQVADLNVNKKQNSYDLVGAFYDEVQRVNILTSSSTLSGLYNYSGDIYIGNLTYSYPTYRYTMKSAASGLVIAGYVSGLIDLGFDWTQAPGGLYASGAAVTNCTSKLSTTLTTLDAEIDTAVTSRTSASESVLARSTRSDLNRDWVRTSYRCRMDWTAPALINNEQIKYYHIKLYKLDPVNQSTVSSGQTHSVFVSDFTKILEAKEDTTTELRKAYSTISALWTPDSVTITGLNSYSGTVLWGSLPTDVQTGDVMAITDGSLITTNYNICSIIENSGILLDRYAAYSIGVDSINIYRLQLESDTSVLRYDFDIYADQYYMFYVRAVTEYDVAGPYTLGYKINTNNLLQGSTGITLRDLVSAEEQQFAKIETVKSQVIKDKFSDQIKTLQRQVADTPRRDNLESLISTVKDLQQSIA